MRVSFSSISEETSEEERVKSLLFHMFAYCMNNPVNMEDPTGNWPQWVKKAVTVYNFEVADFHTYYVDDNAVLVHNVCKSTYKIAI